MTRLLVAFTLLACLSTTSLFANADKVPEALRSFYASFRYAKNVSWTEVNDMTRISFTLDDQQNYAYYNSAGELVVVTRHIVVSELPQSLRDDFMKKYSNYTVSDVYQLTKDETTEYYLILDNSEKHLVLSAKGKKWNLVQAARKK